MDEVVEFLKENLGADDVCDVACPILLSAVGYPALAPGCSLACEL